MTTLKNKWLHLFPAHGHFLLNWDHSSFLSNLEKDALIARFYLCTSLYITGLWILNLYH